MHAVEVVLYNIDTTMQKADITGSEKLKLSTLTSTRELERKTIFRIMLFSNTELYFTVNEHQVRTVPAPYSLPNYRTFT